MYIFCMYTVPVTAVSEEDEVPVPVPDAEARCPELKENTYITVHTSNSVYYIRKQEP